MLLQTNSYIVPKERRAEHARLLRRFRQVLLRLGCDLFEVYEQMGPNWSTGDQSGRFVQIMRFRDRKHQREVHAAEQSDPAAQQLINDFCELINLPYQQQQGMLAIGYYQSVMDVPSSAIHRQAPATAATRRMDPPATKSGFGFGGPPATGAIGISGASVIGFGAAAYDESVDLQEEEALAEEPPAPVIPPARRASRGATAPVEPPPGRGRTLQQPVNLHPSDDDANAEAAAELADPPPLEEAVAHLDVEAEDLDLASHEAQFQQALDAEDERSTITDPMDEEPALDEAGASALEEPSGLAPEEATNEGWTTDADIDSADAIDAAPGEWTAEPSLAAEAPALQELTPPEPALQEPPEAESDDLVAEIPPPVTAASEDLAEPEAIAEPESAPAVVREPESDLIPPPGEDAEGLEFFELPDDLAAPIRDDVGGPAIASAAGDDRQAAARVFGLESGSSGLGAWGERPEDSLSQTASDNADTHAGINGLPTHLIAEEGEIQILFEKLPDFSAAASATRPGGAARSKDDEIEAALNEALRD